MKLFGFLEGDVRTVGLAVRSAHALAIAPLEAFYADVPGALAEAAALEAGFAADRSRPSFARAEVTEVPLVPASAKIICIGMNYASHAAEILGPAPAEPTVFARWASTLDVDGGQVAIPAVEDGLDWEVELAVVIGTRGYRVEVADAARLILGYTAFNDLSARGRQNASSQWTLGKNMPRSGPIGPVLVTRDEIPEPVDLRVRARVNGAVMQDARTSDLIFSAPELIAYVSQTVELRPGDVIATGTPAGVGIARDPSVLLAVGDRVEVEVEQIGVLRTEVVA